MLSFTTLYSIKILYLAFISNPNGLLIDYKNVHEGRYIYEYPFNNMVYFLFFLVI